MKSIAGLWDRKELGWASLIAVFLGAVLLLSVYGCVGEGGVSGGLPIGESELRVTVAIPLTAPQAVALDGVGDSVADIYWNDLPVGTAVRGAVRGGVAGGVRAAGASGVQTGVRAAPADPRRNHLPGHGDGSVATDTGATSSGAEKALFSFEATFTVPVKSASEGTGDLQTRVRSRTNPDVTYMELKVKVDVRASAADPARVEIVAQDVGFNQVELPDLDGDGFSTLFEVVSRGVDSAISAAEAPDVNSLQSKLDSLKSGFENSMKESGFTAAVEIGKVDLTAPQTDVTSDKAQVTSGEKITATLKCDEIPCTFKCSLAGPADGFDFKLCPSPLVLGPTKDGQYTLNVKAADALGNTDLTPATLTFTVLPPAVCGNGTCEAGETTATCSADCPAPDTTPPDTALSAVSGQLSVVSGQSLNKPEVSFTLTATEAGSTFECKLDSQAPASCTSPVTLSVSEGSHTYTVTATDKAGNKDSTPATFTWKVDTAAPETAITKQPSAISGQPSASFEFGCTDPGPLTPGPCSFYCQIDIGVPVLCSFPHSIAGPLSDGSHTFLVFAQDAAGNKDASPSSVTWLVDTTAPDTALSAASGSSSVVSGQVTGGTSIVFTLSSTDVTAAFQCSLDGASFASCSSPVTSSSLTAGSHTFSVKALDGAGNSDSTPATLTWTIDLTAPDTTLGDKPAAVTNQASAYFTFSSPEVGVTFQCALDTAGFATCSSPYSQAALPAGSHAFKVRAVDGVGNADASPAEYTWTIDTTASTFAGATSATADSSSQITVNWTAATDNVSAASAIVYKICASTTSGSCAANFVALATTVAGATTYSATGLSPSTAYYVVVRAQDVAGNTDTNVIEKTATTLAPPAPPDGVAQAITAHLAFHTCALASDGTVRCWGYNSYGQVGDGTSANRAIPVAVSSLAGAQAVAVGTSHSCALLSDGTGRCWGSNNNGQLGDGTTADKTVPAPISNLTNTLLLAAGRDHTCALTSNGTVKCWGNNFYGQLGEGSAANKTTPVAVSSLSNAVALVHGFYHTCSLISDGTARCWGNNGSGQLGDGTTTDRFVPVSVTALTGATVLTSGQYHTCALLSDGTGRCWGFNAEGQLGDGTTVNKTTPIVVNAVTNIVTLAAGFRHTCALLSDGTARCWGYNGTGELGDGTTASPKTAPVSVSTLANAVALTGGYQHTCALLSNGTVKCWGSNGYGGLGDGTTVNKSTPVAVTSLTSPLGVNLPRLHESTASGAPARPWREGLAVGYVHACALISDGTARCWGQGAAGRLGDGTTVSKLTPVPVTSLAGATGLSSGNAQSCAVMSNGTAKCWGSNAFGQVGDGTTTNRVAPTAVSGLSGVLNLVGGFDHSCALLTDGTARCWGYNSAAQLGDGTTANRTTPVVVSGLTGTIMISPAYDFTCALLSDGTVKCWGVNGGGQLGDGTTLNRTAPTTVTSLTGAVGVSSGFSHSCALLSNGTVRCWGGNNSGQLGDGTTAYKTVPTGVSFLSSATFVSGGDTHTCALLANGTAQCWGYNGYGQLGDGTTASKSTAVSVSALSGIASIGAGYGQTCALLSNGVVKCWGSNNAGQLGDGTTVDRLTPVAVTSLP